MGLIVMRQAIGAATGDPGVAVPFNIEHGSVARRSTYLSSTAYGCRSTVIALQEQFFV